MNHTRPDDLEILDAQRGKRGAQCLSHACLDQLALGELAASEASAARAHLQDCAGCAATQQALDLDRREFIAQANLGALAADALRRAERGRAGVTDVAGTPWWQRWVPAVGVVAVVAAGLLLMVRPSGPNHEARDGNRSKGAFALNLYVLHAEAGAQPGGGLPANPRTSVGAVGSLHLSEALHPGDRIRFSVADGKDALIVLSTDEAGQVSIYHAGTPGTGQLTAGERLLPEAIELDQTLGAETIIALRCRGSVSAATAAAAAQRALVGREPAAGPGPLGLPCDEARYVIKKVAR